MERYSWWFIGNIIQHHIQHLLVTLQQILSNRCSNHQSGTFTNPVPSVLVTDLRNAGFAAAEPPNQAPPALVSPHFSQKGRPFCNVMSCYGMLMVCRIMLCKCLWYHNMSCYFMILCVRSCILCILCILMYLNVSCVSFHPSILPSIHLYVNIHVYVHLVICLSVYLYIHQSFCLSIFLSVYPSIHLFIYLSLYAWSPNHLSAISELIPCDFFMLTGQLISAGSWQQPEVMSGEGKNYFFRISNIMIFLSHKISTRTLHIISMRTLHIMQSYIPIWWF